MTDVYRWAVVTPKGRILSAFAKTRVGALKDRITSNFSTDKEVDITIKLEEWKRLAAKGYRLVKFQLVECEDGEALGFSKTEDGLMRPIHSQRTERLLVKQGYRVARFKLVECKEGEGE